MTSTKMQKIDDPIKQDDTSYAVHVVFSERGYWSKTYTYKAVKPYSIGAIVIVPTQHFFAIGKVTGSEKGYLFKPGINYKFVIKEFIPSA